MRISTWNVNGIRACLNKGLLNFIQQERPDILCLQETKAQREQIELSDFDFGFPYATWSSAEKKGYSGTVTFSLREASRSECGIGEGRFDKEGRFVVSDFDDFLLYNIYFPNGAASEERHWYKMDFLAALYKELLRQKKKGREIIVVGDYNIAHKAIDIHDPVRLDGTSGFKPEERAWMDEFFAMGFIDCFRHFYPDQKDAYSWWSYRAGARQRNKGWRIDYISVTPGLKSRLSAVKMLPEWAGSDHCPIVLTIN